MILNFYLIFENGMKKDVNNLHQFHNHNQYNHHQTPSIQICTNNVNTRLIMKSNTGSPITIKNVRSSSLPLKIINNTNRYPSSSTTTTNRSSSHVRSWTDFSCLNKQRNNFDCFNLNGLYFNYKYRQISRSERFLDFIEFNRDQSAEELSVNVVHNFNSSSSISSSSSSPSTINSEFSKVNQKNSNINSNSLTNNNTNKLNEDDEDEFNNNQSNDSGSSSSNEEEISSTNSPINTTLVDTTTKNDENNYNNNIIDLNNTINQEETNKNLTQCEHKLAQIQFNDETTFCIDEKEENLIVEAQQKFEVKTSEKQENSTDKINQKEINTNNNNNNNNNNINSTVIEELIINDKIETNNTTNVEIISNEINDRLIEQNEKTENDNINNTTKNDKIENDTTLNESSLASNLIESTRLDDDLINRENELLEKYSITSEAVEEVACRQDSDKNINNDTLIASSNDIFEREEEELSYQNFKPKKSCLKSRCSLSELSSSDYGSGLLTDGTSTNATSSPLISPSSPSFTSSSSLWSSSITNNESTSTCSSVSSSKKRVLFADDAGKELFTVRTMSEPSNCPPKLTSKIVQYFLNREFNYQNAQTGLNRQLSNDSLGNYASGQFFSSTRSYDYGISGLNYTNDVNQVSGSLAVYSLNFQQPAGDYLKFRQRLEQKCVSLENVLLNGFQVNGTIKVKNINFHKHVSIRCTFNNWQTYEDYHAIYVPCEFYSTPAQLSPTLSSSSISASFCGANTTNYQPIHKEYDTFRFEFQLPKTVENFTAHTLTDRNATASIQLCICYRTGSGDETREFWDNNDGKNYEILQYVIDLERLRPNNHHQVSISSAATAASYQLRNKQKPNYYKYESNKSYASSSLLTSESGIYY